MKVAAFALLLLGASAGCSAAELDGHGWQLLRGADDVKLGIVAGYRQGLDDSKTLNTAGICLSDAIKPYFSSTDECLKTIWASLSSGDIYQFQRFSNDQLLAGLNAFYGDSRNATIALGGAFTYTVHELAGAPKKQLESMAEQMRAASVLKDGGKP